MTFKVSSLRRTTASRLSRVVTYLSSSGWRLIGAAVLLHLILAIALFVAGRAQIAPTIIDRDGIIPSFAYDSYEYQRGATQLAEALRQGAFKAWITAPAAIHVKLISIPFALLGPILGYAPLAAEPFNVLCYAAVLAVVLALGREIGGERVGVIATAAVALWPTFLLHTLQLLKDALFIAAALAAILIVISWLTRRYRWQQALAVAGASAIVIASLLVIRLSIGVLVLAAVGFGFVLLLLRQFVERRLLFWNMVSALPALLVCSALPFLPHATLNKSKLTPSPETGQLKGVANVGIPVATAVTYRRDIGTKWLPFYFAARTDTMAARIDSYRSRFAAAYPEAGSEIDRTTEFPDFSALVSYLPRAIEIGLWAPFPNSWFSGAPRVGHAGKLLSAAETLFIYVFQLLAVVALVKRRREFSLWLLLALAIFGVASLALIVPNVGALYRLRYTFWILLIVLGAKGVQHLPSLRRAGATKAAKTSAHRTAPEAPMSWNAFARLTIMVLALAGLLAVLASRIAPKSPGLPSQEVLQTSAVNSGVGEIHGFPLINLTGMRVRRVYLSRSDSAGWQENILAESELRDGDLLKITFHPPQPAVGWDMRIEGVDDYYAEWKNIDLNNVTRLTLIFKPASEPVAVLRIE